MKTIAIYPGNFQPAHKGHHEVYKMLRKKFGMDVFVAVTSGEPNEHAPLDVNDKILIWVRHGVPASHIVKVVDWKNPKEVYEKFSKMSTAAVYALNQKEVEELSPKRKKQSDLGMRESEEPEMAPKDPNKEVWIGNDNQLSYFQPYEGNEAELESFDKHAYVIIVDDSRIDGRVWTTSNIRQALGDPKYSDDSKKKVFFKIFGWFDIGLYNILNQKFRQAYQVAEPPKPSVSGKQQLRNMVRECLSEIMEGSLDDDESDAPDMASALDKEKSDSEKTKDMADTIAQTQDDLRNHDMETKQHKAQAERDKLSYMNYQKITKQSDLDKKRALEKQLQVTKTMPSL